ncbi:hypothetical protein C8Q75DRAFT_748058 [Abortiporus biennis]|nr:hypothetical protein C8Q75DRAFT_748058 [Abortiporus biennis]
MTQIQSQANASANPILTPSPLPISQLESLRFKTNQIIESIQLLQWTIEAGGQNAMPAWPDILSKYNILLSQSHSLSTSLSAAYQPTSTSRVNGASTNQNPFEKLALHPSVALTETQLDNELIPLLRNQQTTDVLKLENDTVRGLAEHMRTKGSIGVLAPPPTTNSLLRLGMGMDSNPKRTEYDDVLRECEEIRVEHDLRMERAIRAVTMLREKYDWKARVEVDQEEPEELEWDPRLQGLSAMPENNDGMMTDAESEAGNQSNDTDEEEELEEVLGKGEDQTPDGSVNGDTSGDVAMTQG